MSNVLYPALALPSTILWKIGGRWKAEPSRGSVTAFSMELSCIFGSHLTAFVAFFIIG